MTFVTTVCNFDPSGGSRNTWVPQEKMQMKKINFAFCP